MNDHKGLSNYEKLQRIKILRFNRNERKYAAEYLFALRSGVADRINDFEGCGFTVRQFIENKKSYEQGKLFGFDSREVNEHGWLKRPVFLNYEQFEFPHKEKYAILNSVSIAHGPNGKWAYGISHFNGCNGISVWGKRFDDRKECLKAGLNNLKDIMLRNIRLSESDPLNYCKSSSMKVLKQINTQLDIVTGRYVKQLSFFDNEM